MARVFPPTQRGPILFSVNKKEFYEENGALNPLIVLFICSIYIKKEVIKYRTVEWR
jgi:hypothetical protein